MGMYTKLVLSADLKKTTPTEVIEVLKYMLGESEDNRPTVLPEHPLFSDDTRWRFMLNCDSPYFPGCTHHLFKFSETADVWQLEVTTNFKNYSGEVDLFCDWLRPYLYRPTSGETLGFSQYEEAATPTWILA